MMGISRSLNLGLFTGKFTQTTTSTYKPHNYTNLDPKLSTNKKSKINLLKTNIYTLYTGLTTTTNYLNKKELL